MKKNLFIIFCVGLFPFYSFANINFSGFFNDKNAQVFFGPQASYVEFEITDQVLSSNSIQVQPTPTRKGILYGLVGGFEYKKKKSLFANVSASWCQGTVKRTSSPTRFIHDFYWEGRFGYNMHFDRIRKMLLTPYFGFQYSTLDFHRRAEEGYEDIGDCQDTCRII